MYGFNLQIDHGIVNNAQSLNSSEDQGEIVEVLLKLDFLNPQ